MTRDIWQELTCPNCQVDLDRFGPDMMYVGQETTCIHCGASITVTEECLSTFEDTSDGLTYPGNPKSLEELEPLKAVSWG